MAQRAPTFADVAKAAGVSVPTVSRVLTGSIPVGLKRSEQVRAAIKALGYRPNAAARALVTGRRSVIAVLAANTSRYGYARTIEGVEEAARGAGYMTVIAVVETADPDDVNAALDMVLGEGVAGWWSLTTTSRFRHSMTLECWRILGPAPSSSRYGRRPKRFLRRGRREGRMDRQRRQQHPHVQ